MRQRLRGILVALAAALPSAAPAATAECILADRLSMLQEAYVLLLANPNAPRAAEVALYAEALARSVAPDAPSEARAPIADLAAFAETVQAPGSGVSMSLAERTRHLDNTDLLAAVGDLYDCSDTEPPPPGAGEEEEEEEEEGLSAGGKIEWPVAHGNLARRLPTIEPAPGMTEELGSLFTRRNILLGLAALAAASALWLLSLIADEFDVHPVRALVGTATRDERLRAFLPALLKKRRRANHHILGRFFDVTPAETGIRKRVKVADISILGAKLAWSDPPSVGSRIHLDLDGIGRNARVVWTNPHFCGVVFDDELDAAELQMILVRPEEPEAVKGELEMF